MQGWRVSNVGGYDIVNNMMHNTLMDHGVGKEDGNVLCTLILMLMLRFSRGHNACLLVMDCCAVGNCAIVDWLLAFVVDKLGWFHSCGSLYYWNNHGRGPADTRFAQHKSLYLSHTALSLEMYARNTLEKVRNRKTKAFDTATILHPTVPSDFLEYAGQETDGRVPYPTWFG